MRLLNRYNNSIGKVINSIDNMVWFSYWPTFYIAMDGLQIAIGTLSIISGIANLHLIYYMKVWNQFMLLIVNLALSQLIFDITCYLTFCDLPNTICNPLIFRLLLFYMGIVVTLWTNVIVTVLYSSIIYFKPNIVKDNFKEIFTCIHLFGLLIGILMALSGYYDNVRETDIIGYIWISFRLLSIVYNTFVIIFIYREVSMFDKNNPVRELINRLIYYPIVQIISFAPTTWFQYGYAYIDFADVNIEDPYYKASYCLSNLFLYSAGIGFFITFLLVQPNAYNFLINYWKSYFCCQNILSTNKDNITNDDVMISCSQSFDLSRLSDLELTMMIMEKTPTNSDSIVMSGIHSNSSLDVM